MTDLSMKHTPWHYEIIHGIYMRVYWHYPFAILRMFFNRDQCRPLLSAWKRFMSGSVGRIISMFYKEKPCVRKLKYLGCYWCEEINNEEDFFKVGSIYWSITFNGATYTIKNYCGRIGCAYFEVLERDPLRVWD